jgi:SAM-dependent methyltransferase
MIFSPSAEHPTPEEELHRYRRHKNSADNTGYVNMLSEVLDLVRRFGPAGGSLLDYGCGPKPVFVDMCRRAGYDAYGYDPYFLDKLAAEDCFDVICAVEVWEHFRSPAKEIRRQLSHLAPSGLLVIRTLLHGGVEKFASWWYARDNTHLSFYNNRTFDRITADFNLTPVFSDGEKFFLFTSNNSG